MTKRGNQIEDDSFNVAGPLETKVYFKVVQRVLEDTTDLGDLVTGNINFNRDFKKDKDEKSGQCRVHSLNSLT